MSRRTCQIPDGLEDLLLKLTVSILKKQPKNLNEYCFNYFKSAIETTTTAAKTGDDKNQPDFKLDDTKEEIVTGRSTRINSIKFIADVINDIDNCTSSKKQQYLDEHRK